MHLVCTLLNLYEAQQKALQETCVFSILGLCLWPLTGVTQALRTRNLQNVEKRFPGALGPQGRKGLQISKKSANGVENNLFSKFSTLFRLLSTFFDLSVPGNLVSSFGGFLGRVPTTPEPNTSAEVSRYKWEPYCDTNWWCISNFLLRGGHTFAEVSR